MTFLENLSQKGVIKEEDILTIAQKSQESGKSTEEVLSGMGVSENEILEAKSEYLDIPVRHLAKKKIPFNILKNVPEESAAHYKFVPLSVEEGVLEVGIVDPDNMKARDALQFISAKINMPTKVFLISQSDFDAVIKSYKGLKGEVTKALSEIETEIKGAEGVELLEKDEEKKGEAKIKEEAPVTKITAVIIRHATEGNASDVHIEPMEDKVRVRFRVDGVLYTSLILPLEVHSAVVARIKILANLKLDEKRKPQDGRFSARIDGRKIDFRVSTFPSYYGEKVVMRILDSEKGVKKLDSMGLSQRNLDTINAALKRPYGLILITGPTGSGKTTTLYSMINELDREQSNIVTLEDPVEYNIPGISQSQVRPEIGYTFANGLRSILRQDPDIIMVGEIRDKETAGLAIQAALTGHLVFSTLHTNNAIGVIPRLIDMGVDPYLIAPTLILVIAQRLVKTLCPDSKKPIPLNESMRIMLDKQFADLPEAFKKDIIKGENFYEAVPSPSCPGGTSGRTPVFEILQVDSGIEGVILRNPVEPEIWKAARKNGMLTLKEDAIGKAFNGIISFGEVNTL
ncbi:MAG: type IV-A pilus assembly ATPase PilB [Patescibacteria group bacterium]|nr:MAG: type IV-A pilus assembly ATPase PilB [Patescibacteria group bacterium]